MKYFKIVVTLVVITMVAASLGFAGKANGTAVTPQGDITKGTPVVFGDQLNPHRPAAGRSIQSIRANPELASPIPPVKQVSGITAGLSGLYKIPLDFPTIGDAVAVLNFVGVSGDVTFELDNASYTENAIVFGAFPGAGTYTVTVQPKAATAVTVNFNTTLTSGKGFAFNGAKGIIIDGLNTGGASLTLQYSGAIAFPSGDPFAATIYVTGGSDHITVKNANIMGEILGTPFENQTDGRPAVFVFRTASDAVGNSNITIDHCVITRATFGLKVLTETNGNHQGPISYTYNNVGGAYGDSVSHGGVVDQVDGMHYDNNVLDGIYFASYYWNNYPTEYDVVATFASPGNDFFTDFGQPSAGHFYYCDAASTISYNYVKNTQQNYNDPGFAFIVYGLLARYGTGALVHDNRITGVATTDADGTIGGLRGESARMYHNSIRLTGVLGASQVSYCMRTAGSATQLNNAMSNEMTGLASSARGMSGLPSSTSNGNAVYAGRYVSGYTTLNAYLATGKDANSVFGPVNFTPDMHIAGGPSSAENIGIAHVLLAPDIDGDVRDTSYAGVRDAGADDFANTGSLVAVDILPAGITAPNPAGIPSGLAVVPQVLVKNNSNNTVGSFDVNLTISDGYNQTVTTAGGMVPQGEITISFPTWTAAAGTWTMTATTMLVDANNGNNIVSRSQLVQPPTPLITDTTFTWNAGAQGWTGSNDFVRDNAFTKLGGPYDSYAWITEAPYNHATYTEGAYANTQGYSATYPGPNLLTSPWYSLSGMPDTTLYISFMQSIKVEMQWDGGWWDYTTDGTTWKKLGTVNDPKGVNWFSTAVYSNALSLGGDPPDTATMKLSNYMLYGPGTDNPTLPMAFWTSNGTSDPTGPNGWVYNQLKVTPSTYPDLVKAPLVKFRYVAFSDAATAYEGWAIDNFRLATHTTVFTGGSITGKIFTDVNGNGVYDAGTDSVDAGKKIYISYFGILKDSVVTDFAGDYTWNGVTLPGVYNIKEIKPGYAFTSPFGLVGIVDVNHPADGSTLTGNIASYIGSVTGLVFSDVNNDSTKNAGEPGVGGYTVQVYTSPGNVLVASPVSIASGVFTTLLPPHAYYAKLVPQVNMGRQTFPKPPVPDSSYFVISGNSGSPSALATGVDFGVFLYPQLLDFVSRDINGDGIFQPGDQTALPLGTGKVILRIRNLTLATIIGYDTLGDGAAPPKIHTGLEFGSQYSVTRISPVPAGWLQTTYGGGDSVAFTVTAGGIPDTAFFGFFKYVVVSGVKFNDLNGNGARDAGEPGLVGWTINITGTGGGSVVTDSVGSYSIGTIGPGSHTVSEVAQTGWTQTAPAGGTFTFTAQTGDLSGSNKTVNFGNFHSTCISGIKYRDRNGNGVMDPGEEPLAGWTINLSGHGSTVTLGDGSFQFCDVGSGIDTLTETPQAGWTLTQPASGSYIVTVVSGVPITGLNFGNLQPEDAQKYRTFTPAQLLAASEEKVLKVPSPKKPITYAPTSANLINAILKGGGAMRVGLSGQMNSAGKEKAYLLPAKQGDVYKTFANKAKAIAPHTGSPKGFDFTNNAKVMLKKYKAIPSVLQNNTLTANLLALQVSLTASTGGYTPAGLGSLIYFDPGRPFGGLTIDQIADTADVLMTNWGGIPYNVYTALDSIVAKLLDAFKGPVTTDTTLTGGWRGAKLGWMAYTSPYQVPFVHVNPGVPPESRHIDGGYVAPEVYQLAQNYPNPFNPTTTVEFSLPEASIVTLKIYNVLGQEVATLLDRQSYDSGEYGVDFDATSLASGVYLYRIVAETANDDGVGTGKIFTQVKKMVLLK